MGDAQDATLRLSLEGTGPYVKNYKVIGLRLPDGSIVDVLVQATTIQDADGRSVDFSEMLEELRKIRTELKWIRKAFGEMTENAQAMVGLEEIDDEDGSNQFGGDT